MSVTLTEEDLRTERHFHTNPRTFVLSLLIAATACKDKAEAPEPSSTPEPSTPTASASSVPSAPKPPALNADGLPSTVALVPGSKLIEAKPDGDNGVWTYAYAGTEPDALAEKERAALESAGWKTVVRREVVESIPPPVRSVFGSRDGKLVVAQAYRDPAGATQLRVFLQLTSLSANRQGLVFTQ